jgi:ribonuclease P protein component
VLPAANRLRTAADFRDTTRRGAKASRGSVVLYLKSSGATVQPRIGVIVSKAVGGSVQRHRAARRIRAAVRPLLGSVPSGSVLVVRALPGADTDPRLARDLNAGLCAILDRSSMVRSS